MSKKIWKEIYERKVSRLKLARDILLIGLIFMTIFWYSFHTSLLEVGNQREQLVNKIIDDGFCQEQEYEVYEEVERMTFVNKLLDKEKCSKLARMYHNYANVHWTEEGCKIIYTDMKYQNFTDGFYVRDSNCEMGWGILCIDNYGEMKTEMGVTKPANKLFCGEEIL